MILGSLEHAMVKIEQAQKDLALAQLQRPQTEGKDAAFVFGLYAGKVQGLTMAREIILAILNPPDAEKANHGR